MKFGYMVKHNGKYYLPNEDVPCGEVETPIIAETVVETEEVVEDVEVKPIPRKKRK